MSAMAAALMPSPTIKSAFSPHTDSPSSPAPFALGYRAMQRNSAPPETSSLAASLQPPASPYPAHVDPSPVESTTSTSTESTDIDIDHDHEVEDIKSPDIEILSPSSALSESAPGVQFPQSNTTYRPDADHELKALPPVRIDTASARKVPEDNDAPQSVIHAPEGFKDFSAHLPSHEEDSESTYSLQNGKPVDDKRKSAVSLAQSDKSEHTIKSPSGNASNSLPRPLVGLGRKDTTPINTQIPISRHGAGSTPRASTQEEAEEEWRRRQSIADELGFDALDGDTDDGEDTVESIGTALRNLNSAEQEVESLKTALSECWTLCNTLANLSSTHRERMFSFSGHGDVQEQAWKSCWRLCQKLYESRDEDHASHVKPTLELCRQFCQALFEARTRGDEVTDSILRVSFELNNHLYNTHDRNLPDIFRERTLDFYLTMCHRLMKQRTSLPEETDSLLRACWSLAEMLFSLRQNNRDNKPVDEELLGSAVQACWDLCDLFREGWTQIRPDRGTPRPVQRVFPGSQFPSQSSYAPSQTGSLVSRPGSALSRSSQPPPPDHLRHNFVPETPTTIFDDLNDASPSEEPVPNILVLGPGNQRSATPWSSTTSVSGYSEASSQRTVHSVRTTQQATTPRAFSGNNDASQTSPKSNSSAPDPSGEDPSLVRLKALILYTAQTVGYPRSNPGAPPNTLPPLPSYVKTLSATAFGTLQWQVTLFENYQKLVITDPTLRDPAGLPMGRKFTAYEIAKAVNWIGRSEGYGWLSFLFRWVFGFPPEEAGGLAKKGVVVQV